jgi:hypothetical protein
MGMSDFGNDWMIECSPNLHFDIFSSNYLLSTIDSPLISDFWLLTSDLWLPTSKKRDLSRHKPPLRFGLFVRGDTGFWRIGKKGKISRSKKLYKKWKFFLFSFAIPVAFKSPTHHPDSYLDTSSHPSPALKTTNYYLLQTHFSPLISTYICLKK